jgi:hypothetical protein
MSSCCNKRIASNAPSSSHVRNLRHNSCKLHAAAGGGGHLLMKQFATLRSLQTHLSSCPFTVITPCFGGARSWRGDKAELFRRKLQLFSGYIFYRRPLDATVRTLIAS